MVKDRRDQTDAAVVIMKQTYTFDIIRRNEMENLKIMTLLMCHWIVPVFSKWCTSVVLPNNYLISTKYRLNFYLLFFFQSTSHFVSYWKPFSILIPNCKNSYRFFIVLSHPFYWILFFFNYPSYLLSKVALLYIILLANWTHDLWFSFFYSILSSSSSLFRNWQNCLKKKLKMYWFACLHVIWKRNVNDELTVYVWNWNSIFLCATI